MLVGIPLLAAVLVFMGRSPVLVVSDLAFDGIYGEVRIKIKQAEASLRLWRPVRRVRIAEDAGEDVAVFAVRSAAEKPFCVLFPYRYHNEAKRYSGEFPESSVAVLQGRFRDLSDSGGAANLFFFGTDSALDFYRAGQCAAIFARPVPPEKVSPEAGKSGDSGEASAESPEAEVQEPGTIFLLQDDLVSDGDREAFSRGLAENGYDRTPVYQNAGTAFTTRPNTACAVISGAAQNFFEQSLDIPVLLFSWIDPALTPARIKLVFDDSPWALAVPAVKTIGRQRAVSDINDSGNIKSIPSEIQLLSRRISRKERLGDIKRAIRSRGP
ncbi:hypothetical protein FACS189473_3740 [Spirochaetia bacterium]|nr:hypothetical protein FACS189473_3740 [Spirochaetia bacterium]